VNGSYSIPILTIIVVGYLTKYVPAIAAKVAIISGVLLYISYIVLDEFVFVGQFPHFLHVMAIVFIINVLVMLLIGKYKPRKEAYQQKYTKQVDITPWKYLNTTGIVICIIVLGIYIYFA
jgi:SSS family solute:Na+ symporter